MLLGERLGEFLVERVHESLRVKPRLVGADQHGEVLGHATGFHGLDDHVFKCFGKVGDLGSVVQLRTMLETTGPCED